MIPRGKYLINPILLKGPCKGNLNVTINGRLMAPTDHKYWFGIDHWISFRYITGLIIGGHGVLDGQGHHAWPSNTCMKDPKCKKLPIVSTLCIYIYIIHMIFIFIFMSN